MKTKFLTSLLLAGATQAADVKPLIVEGEQQSAVKYDNVLFLQYEQTVCTGTLIGKNHVLTAGHCLYYPDKPLDNRNQPFIAWTRGHFGVAGNTLTTSQEWTQQVHNDRATRFAQGDVAISKLSRDIHAKTAFFLSKNQLPINGAVQSFGYEGEKAVLRSMKGTAHVSDHDGIAVKSTDANGRGHHGDSGGPTVDDKYNFVGVTSAVYCYYQDIQIKVDCQHKRHPEDQTLIAPIYRQSNIEYILNTVKDWHYAGRHDTVNGAAKITIQSIFPEGQLSPMFVSTDEYTVTDCDHYMLAPLEKCELTVTRNDGLDKPFSIKSVDGYGVEILFNQPGPTNNEPKPAPQPASDGGGSTGAFVLSFLAFCLLARKSTSKKRLL